MTRARSLPKAASVLGLLLSLIACGVPSTPSSAPGAAPLRAQSNTTYYVDCSAGAGNGTQASPWNSLSSVNATTFSSGDSILLKRGSTCTGQLAPKGSGASGAPITVGAYGTGALPVIQGGGNDAAVKLYNQQYWTLSSLETVGGNPWGIYVGGNVAGTLNGITVQNVLVHDVGGVASDKETGGIVIEPGSAGTAFNNVLVDGATVRTTKQWAGILVGTDDFYGAGYGGSPFNTNVTVRNSTVSDTYGEGILVDHSQTVLLDNNVAHDVGKIPDGSVGTPNAIWTWWCKDCTVQNNEGYNVASPGVDGGVYDIDYWSDNTTVQYNYGHDAQGYCVAVLGAADRATTNSVVRYNVCANNGRTAYGATQGDFNTNTWAGGSLDGVQIYNNTSYWNPAGPEAALINPNRTYSGTRPRLFKNNLIYSTVPQLIWTDTSLQLDNNLYYYTGGSSAYWGYNGTWYTSFAAYQSGSGQDAHGKNTDPLLNTPTAHAVGKPSTALTLQSGSPAINAGSDVGSMGSRDFYGNAIPQGGSYDIGANEFSGQAGLVVNPSFESGLTGWTQWWDTGVNATNVGVVTSQGGRTGSSRLVHWSASAPYRQYTAQVVGNLSPGTYRLQVYMQTNGALSELNLGGKNCNGLGTQELALPRALNYAWTPYAINLTVSGSQCEIFVWSRSPGGAEAFSIWDDVSLVRQ